MFLHPSLNSANHDKIEKQCEYHGYSTDKYVPRGSSNRFPLLPLGSKLSGNRYLPRGKNGNVPFTTAFGNLPIAWHGIQCKSFRKKTIYQEI